VFVVTYHGVAEESFWPTQEGSAFALPPSLEPLSRYRDRLLIVKGVDMSVPDPALGYTFDDDNFARVLLTGKMSHQGGRYPEFEAGAPSLDAIVHEVHGGGAAVPMCIRVGGKFDPFWEAAGVVRPCESDVSRFATRFGTNAPSSARDSVAYFEQDLPRFLALGAQALSSRRTLQLGIVLHPSEAFAQARLGLPNGMSLHEMLHRYAGAAPDAVAFAAGLNRFQAGAVSLLLDELAALRDGQRSLLDRTVVVWTSALATPSHGVKNLPVVIIGDADGVLRTGAFVDSGRRSHLDLLATLAVAFKLPPSAFPPSGVTAQPIRQLIRE
jgi:hypothetical protein